MLLIVGSVFTLVGLGAGAAALAERSAQPILTAILGILGAIFLLMGVIALVLHARGRSRPQPAPADWRPLDTADVAQVPLPATTPWSFDQLAAGLVHAFAETPYRVSRSGESLIVRADIADAQWWQLFERHELHQAYAVTLRRTGERTVERGDALSRVEWSAGTVGGPPRLSFGAEQTVGRVWTTQKRTDVVLGPDLRVSRPVDFSFSSTEVQRPVKEVLERADWRTALDANARMGLIAASIGGGLALLVVVALVIAALTGQFH